MSKSMTMAEAFDEWMRKYKEDPAGFAHTIQSCRAHDVASDVPGVSEYGKDCSALLQALIDRGADAWTVEAAQVGG
jgi:hypothetical protein